MPKGKPKKIIARKKFHLTFTIFFFFLKGFSELLKLIHNKLSPQFSGRLFEFSHYTDTHMYVY
jgi:hypothetical protein